MEIKQIVKAFSALAQETRVNIIKRLVEVGEQGVCPCCLVKELKLTNSNLSFHLKELENAGLIQKRKEGKFIYYYADCCFIKSIGDFLIEDCCRFKCATKKDRSEK